MLVCLRMCIFFSNFAPLNATSVAGTEKRENNNNSTK